MRRYASRGTFFSKFAKSFPASHGSSFESKARKLFDSTKGSALDSFLAVGRFLQEITAELRLEFSVALSMNPIAISRYLGFELM